MAQAGVDKILAIDTTTLTALGKEAKVHSAAHRAVIKAKQGKEDIQDNSEPAQSTLSIKFKSERGYPLYQLKAGSRNICQVTVGMFGEHAPAVANHLLTRAREGYSKTDLDDKKKYIKESLEQGVELSDLIDVDG